MTCKCVQRHVIPGKTLKNSMWPGEGVNPPLDSLYERTTPVVHFGLRIPQRFFAENSKNGLNGILRGSGKLVLEKSRKSRGTVPPFQVCDLHECLSSPRRERHASNRRNSANCLSAMLYIFVDLNLTGLVNVKVRRIGQNPEKLRLVRRSIQN